MQKIIIDSFAGVELRAEQIEANREQAEAMASGAGRVTRETRPEES